MEVILLEKIANLGALGDRVTVKAGYGRNYLIPQAKAVAATADNIEAFESRRAELEKEAAQILSAAEARATAVAALELTISANAGEEGKLFGSVGARDIAQAAADAGVELDRSEIRLPDGPVREVGEYAIEVGLHPEVETSLKVIVVPEEALES
ncbi:MAG: 50S ribosomal protein L9 [Gammaproteobacteria bacterium]|jgi:large subunit ribosomal protein L9|tara:strand:- start:377 stop:838 length:462 start_codon:yes stop_codon:yes gene_type:complete